MSAHYTLQKIFLIICILLSLALTCAAQDPTYSIYWNDRTYLNPALTGSDRGLYIATHYRNQWPKVTSKFVTYSVSADIFEPNLSGGIGVRALQNVEGEGVQTSNEFGLTYSYIATTQSRVSSLAFALGASVFSRVIDQSKLIFSDQLDPVNGNIYTTGADIEGIDKANVANFNAGISFRSFLTKKSHSFYNIGISFMNITQPNISLTNQTARLPIRYTAYLDVTTKRNRPSGRFIFYLKPAAIVVVQRGATGTNFTSMRIGINMDSNPLTAGFFYKNESFGKISSSESFITMIGVNLGSSDRPIRIMYSYDYTISSLAVSTGGAHEVGLSMFFKNVRMFKKNNHQGRQRMIHCPDFDGAGFMPSDM